MTVGATSAPSRQRYPEPYHIGTSHMHTRICDCASSSACVVPYLRNLETQEESATPIRVRTTSTHQHHKNDSNLSLAHTRGPGLQFRWYKGIINMCTVSMLLLAPQQPSDGRFVSTTSGLNGIRQSSRSRPLSQGILEKLYIAHVCYIRNKIPQSYPY